MSCFETMIPQGKLQLVGKVLLTP